MLARLYHLLVRQYPDAENHFVAGNKHEHPDLAPVSLTNLAYQTRDFLQRHGGKLLSNKKSAGVVESWMESVEDFVYSRGLTQYDDWANVQEIIAQKSMSKEVKEVPGEEIDEEEEEKRDLEAF